MQSFIAWQIEALIVSNNITHATKLNYELSHIQCLTRAHSVYIEFPVIFHPTVHLLTASAEIALVIRKMVLCIKYEMFVDDIISKTCSKNSKRENEWVTEWVRLREKEREGERDIYVNEEVLRRSCLLSSFLLLLLLLSIVHFLIHQMAAAKECVNITRGFLIFFSLLSRYFLCVSLYVYLNERRERVWCTFI